MFVNVSDVNFNLKGLKIWPFEQTLAVGVQTNMRSNMHSFGFSLTFSVGLNVTLFGLVFWTALCLVWLTGPSGLMSKMSKCLISAFGQSGGWSRGTAALFAITSKTHSR